MNASDLEFVVRLERERAREQEFGREMVRQRDAHMVTIAELRSLLHLVEPIRDE